MLGINIGFLVGGTLVIESVFALPGIGNLMIQAILNRDFPVVQGVTLVFAIMVVLVNLATDVLHSLLEFAGEVRLMGAPPEGLVEPNRIKHVGLGFRRRWYRSKAFVGGAAILVIIIGVAVAAPLFTSYDPIKQDLSQTLLSPSSSHPLGTDQLGRDVWARLVYGARVILRVGFVAVLFAFCLGTFLGCLAGYFGRWFDTGVMRAVDVVVAFPFFVLVIALVFALGQGTRSIYIAITLVGWVSYARIIRGETLVAKRQEYVLAAQAAGFSDLRVMARHILPNVITQAIVFGMSDMVLVILAIVTLGYLGLGIPPPTPDWGSMIFDGQTFITTDWQLSTIPGIAIVITGLGLSLLGDGLADLLRPEAMAITQPLLEVRDLRVEDRISAWRRACRRWGDVQPRERRGPRSSRRVGLWEDHDAASHPRVAAATGGDREREGALRWPRPGAAVAEGPQQGSGRFDQHDLPGAYDRAEPSRPGGPPDLGGSAPVPSGLQPETRP